jgi:transposase
MVGYLTHFHFKKARTPFRKVVPPLSKAEKTNLRQAIEERGVDHPIEVDPEGNILDGHHRQDIEGDCKFTIKHGLKTQAEKKAYAYSTNANRRNMSVKAQRIARAKMKQTAIDLREDYTQEETAAWLGVSRATVRRWETPAVTGNGRPAISGKGRPPSLNKQQKQEIKQRLAKGETQTAIAEDMNVAQQTISDFAATLRNRTPPPKDNKAKTISERAVAVRLDVGGGLTVKEAAKRYEFAPTTYNSAALVAESGNQLLIAAMDSEVIPIGTARRLLDSPRKEQEETVEEARVKQLRKRHKQVLGNRRNKTQLLLETLETTYIQWRELPVDIKVIPKDSAKLSELRILAVQLRELLNERFNTLERSIKQCSQKTTAKKTS